MKKSRFFTKFFRTIVEKESFNKIDSDEIEEFIYLFSILSYREILALHRIREFTLQNVKVRQREDEGFISSENNWKEVIIFFRNKLRIKNIVSFLSKLERTGLIIKNRTHSKLRNSSDFNNNPSILGGEYGYFITEQTIYLSTYYFEGIYLLSDDIDEYLNKCTDEVL